MCVCGGGRDGQSQDGDVLQMASYILKKLPETVEADHVTERTLLLKDIIVRVNTAAEGAGTLCWSHMLHCVSLVWMGRVRTGT